MKNSKIKKSKSFSITESVYREFSELAERMAINKSRFVENALLEFIKNNKKPCS
ncbi:MAG: ribbon-helix-helix domain-containing protein [bacterium]